ncbi:LIC_13387 family protein [Ferruginibacter sp.]
MRAQIFLKIASVIMLIHNIGHTIGHLGWTKAKEAGQKLAIDAMQNNKFMFMGRKSSFGKFYEGYGWAGTISMLLVMLLLWWGNTNSPESRRVVVLITLFLVCWGIMEWICFFPMAAIFSFVAATCCIIALCLKK